MIPLISGCTTQGSPALGAVHQIGDDGLAIYDDDPIAVEPQLDEDELDRVSGFGSVDNGADKRKVFGGVQEFWLQKRNSDRHIGRCAG